MIQFELTINCADGIHARPAGQLVKEAQKYSSAVTLEKSGKTADLKRLFAVLGLNVKQGNTVKIFLEGENEQAEAEALKTYMQQNFC